MNRFLRMAFLLCVANGAAQAQVQKRLLVGAEQFNVYLPALKDKRVGLLVNNTSKMGHVHLVDVLISLKVDVKKIFSPEHGFRGDAAAGEKVSDAVDTKTGLPIVSLYGDNRKPTPEQLKDIDVVIFDIQDVGTRFFTYISTLHYMMEACAESNKKLIVLDRPNPNGYVDGPMLKPELISFVGMHPIPIVHGLTVGELAQMINGEGWHSGLAVTASQAAFVRSEIKCDLLVIPMVNYTHNDSIKLPVKPSPNLTTDHAVALYPSICFFEGTVLSLGRGTHMPFEVLGHPDLKNQPFQFTPVEIKGMALNPPHEDKVCFGVDLRKEKAERKISLKYVIDMYRQFPDKEKFFTPYFNKLAGTTVLMDQIKQGLSEEQIRETWQKDLASYKEMRKKYLLYP